ncbi:hypothetical protein L3Q65_46195 [Amycolatopsis sp. FU40]|uniref:hypothetical protein n=1 Tax=Amycolatopsis sp. FU40 TaxID=2914159 RepID=UPI001F32E6E4|nr:hypothetical protein [Amycolatopsis sp. FU40]UKD55167.1 hypothetical protein L3Q65_46195 [Amycolatopsis sp. FU40]
MIGQHADAGGSTEPVAIAEAVRALLVAVVATGWVVIPDSTVNIVVSVIGFAGSIVSTILARRKVVPVSKLDPIYAEDVPRTPPAADAPKEG